jgi:hypothetical protein
LGLLRTEGSGLARKESIRVVRQFFRVITIVCPSAIAEALKLLVHSDLTEDLKGLAGMIEEHLLETHKDYPAKPFKSADYHLLLYVLGVFRIHLNTKFQKMTDFCVRKRFFGVQKQQLYSIFCIVFAGNVDSLSHRSGNLLDILSALPRPIPSEISLQIWKFIFQASQKSALPLPDFMDWCQRIFFVLGQLPDDFVRTDPSLLVPFAPSAAHWRAFLHLLYQAAYPIDHLLTYS